MNPNTRTPNPNLFSLAQKLKNVYTQSKAENQDHGSESSSLTPDY